MFYPTRVHSLHSFLAAQAAYFSDGPEGFHPDIPPDPRSWVPIPLAA